MLISCLFLFLLPVISAIENEKDADTANNTMPIVLPHSFSNLTNDIQELEVKMFIHLNYKHHFADGKLQRHDILCNCTNKGCDDELTKLIGPEYKGLCRARRGICRAAMRRVRMGQSTAEKVHYDCLHEADLDPNDKPFKCLNTRYINYMCCNDSLCSRNHDLEVPDEPDPDYPEVTTVQASEDDGVAARPLADDAWALSQWIAFVALLLCSLILIVALILFAQWRSRTFRDFLLKMYHSRLYSHADVTMMHEIVRVESSTRLTGATDEEKLIQNETGAATLSTLLRDLETTNSGSGSGLPLLIQRTIALQIEIQKDIGQGRFGEVKLGVWRGENIAVKIFSSRDERSFTREVEIYNTNWLRHSNILQFIASDKKDTGATLELWLISEYHPNGSLYDFLQRETIEPVIAVQLVRSFANGMQFLHSEVPGQHNKPAIAHRDIKSKNILVRRDLTCVIADLGLAVRYGNGELNIPDNSKCGTVRYLAPEILDDSLVYRNFESFKMADLYAFGLVMWEIARRTRTPDVDCFEFEQSIPYYEYVPRDPSIPDMKRVVVVEGRRPCYSPHWRLNPVLDELYRVMAECWRPSPSSRLTAMNVRMAMDRLARRRDLPVLT